MGEDRWTDDERRYWDRNRQAGRSDSWRGEQGGIGRDQGRGAHNDRGMSSRGRFDEDYGQGGGRFAASQDGYSANRDWRGGDNRDAYGDADYRGDSGWRSDGSRQSQGGYDRDQRGYGQGGSQYGSSFAGNQRQGRSFQGSMPSRSGEGYRYQSGGYGASNGNRDYRGYGDDDRNWLDKAGDEVASWFGDDDAARRREMDKGHSGKGPKGYARSDDRIREDINDRLTYDRHIDASNISVEVKDGEVTLSGTIGDRADKRHAEDIAEGISGVKHVQNNLRVAQPTRPGESVAAAGERSNSTTGSYVASGGVAAGLGGSTASPNGTATSRTQ
ncbi:Osmotically-inducible protein OsmY, contains BON domain [Devosia enhydra]|uniref:Osmotically-inducible protein OsmY, contains BON domain n=1 Tax=Devosia enhydra TaxID=665118 RepID=A0A1K2HT26_9HYPH|nr:BON domain-containing protein [Devosia enhydra]SFZ81281.1 Osmotically-inducible protein OsmY, contains BON domain [Devosia enhydra]